MSQVISVLHDKGGCAKTTTAVNLGFALWLLGKKVLLIDTDPQCNLTDTVDKTVHKEADSTIYEWMHDSKPGEELPLPIYTRYDGLDYIPGSHSMSNINAELQLMYNREHRLADFLDIVDPESGAKIRNMYDYIFIDCAPGGETLMNTNALVASDFVIVPTEAGIGDLPPSYRRPVLWSGFSSDHIFRHTHIVIGSRTVGTVLIKRHLVGNGLGTTDTFPNIDRE